MTPKTLHILPFFCATILLGAVSCHSEPSTVDVSERVFVPAPPVLDDTITVTLDPRAKVLVVEGYDGSSLPNILDILNVGDYHGAEPWLYSESLRRNIRARIRSFRN